MVGCELDGYRELFDVCIELMLAIHRLPQPVIAQVHGIATAAGCQLVAACDLAVAAERRALRHAGRAHRPVLLDADGRGVAGGRAASGRMEMLLTGDPIDAADRRRLGPDQPGGARRASSTRRSPTLAARVAAASSRTIEIGKRAFYEQLDVPIEDAYEHAKEVMALNAAEHDAQEGISAFLGKREPTWEGERRRGA